MPAASRFPFQRLCVAFCFRGIGIFFFFFLKENRAFKEKITLFRPVIKALPLPFKHAHNSGSLCVSDCVCLFSGIFRHDNSIAGFCSECEQETGGRCRERTGLKDVTGKAVYLLHLGREHRVRKELGGQQCNLPKQAGCSCVSPSPSSFCRAHL